MARQPGGTKADRRKLAVAARKRIGIWNVLQDSGVRELFIREGETADEIDDRAYRALLAARIDLDALIYRAEEIRAMRRVSG